MNVMAQYRIARRRRVKSMNCASGCEPALAQSASIQAGTWSIAPTLMMVFLLLPRLLIALDKCLGPTKQTT